MKIKLFTIPNVLTLANLFCGCIATLFAAHYHPFENPKHLEFAFYMIILAGVFDFLDGMVARALNAFSEVGKQLDSLSDIVSFGVAPSIILYSVYQASGGGAWYAAGAYLVFVLALFSALRLAKFNVDESQSDSFTGLPTPACGIFVAAAGYIFSRGELGIELHPAMVLVVAACLSYLLVSPIKMMAFKFKTWGVKENATKYVLIALSLVALIIFRVTAIPFIILAYVLISIIQTRLSARRVKKAGL